MFEKSDIRKKVFSAGAIGTSVLALAGCGNKDPNAVGDCPLNYQTTLTVSDSGAVARAFAKAETELDGELKTVTDVGERAKLERAHDQLFDGSTLRYVDDLGRIICNYTPTIEVNPVLVLTPFAQQAIGKLEAAGISVNLKNATLNVPDLNDQVSP